MITLVDTGAQRPPAIAIPTGLRRDRVESHQVDLLEVAPDGVRVRHERGLEAGAFCTLILPSAPEALHLSARIMWTHSWESTETHTGERRFHHESCLVFLQPLPAQQIPVAYSFLKRPH